MSLNKLKGQKLPTYTKGEEIFNYVSHIVGGAMGVVFLVLGIILCAKNNIPVLGIFGIIVYGISIITLYTISSVYHGLSPRFTSKKVLRILDHCTIYLLIAGTYTPVIAIALQGTWIGILMFVIEWVGATVGILLNALDMTNKFVKLISMILYIVMGWAIIFVPQALSFISTPAFVFILIGGICYTVGVIFYSVGAKKKWFHSIFHIFCDLGTLTQFFGIIFIIIQYANK